jgi:hypothetical protein
MRVSVDGGIGKAGALIFDRGSPAASAGAKATPRARVSPAISSPLTCSRHAPRDRSAWPPPRSVPVLCRFLSTLSNAGSRGNSMVGGIRRRRHFPRYASNDPGTPAGRHPATNTLRHPPPVPLLPPIEVPSSPFASEGEEGTPSRSNEAEPGPSRSGSNAHDAGTETTAPDSVTPPARGVGVDPAEQDAAQRSNTQHSRHHSPRPPTPASRSDSSSPKPKYPRHPRHHREQRPLYSRGKLARRQIPAPAP